ncbi:class I SAM-dependent DNA methyltransferase [Embleya scabrispora]|uniref:class I SAM-dependent DNA methyltransferase n=1 Tax=Embleya scabrispora TaxID=159449 RepID=UPI0003764552|nr:class I SAM-dependent methyltransferase [Embleya scabrispora]MYS81524.1 methyltransferase domain-containing protein [Streptomyces sp. SID5474]
MPRTDSPPTRNPRPVTTTPDPAGGVEQRSEAAAEPAGSGYADAHAADYDRWFGKPGITGATVDALAGLAGSGPVLELGIGTGRVALPLARRGLRVHGIDASEAMVRHLRGKPGGSEIPITMGDFAEVGAPGPFSLIYLAGGTFFELPDSRAKQRCLAAAQARLQHPGGVFVFDAHLPEALAVAAASGVPEVVAETDEHLILCHRRIDASTQTYHSHYLIHESDRTRHLRVAFHYASPGELDLLARRSGLRLKQRLGSWAGAPFTRDSTYHVSVYEPATPEQP